MKNLSYQLFKPLMVDDLKLGKNEICQKCDAKFKSPLVPWLVGSKFKDASHRILFVGKPHRADGGGAIQGQVLETNTKDLDWLMDSKWAYWRYTREIAAQIYGEENPWDYIALSNVIKCTNVDGTKGSIDTTSNLMARSCVSDLRVIHSEIRLLKPHTIVFYTFFLFRELLEDLPSQIEGSNIVHHSEIDNRVACGAKKLGWWDRSFSTSWSDKVRVLVTGHPERMLRVDYVDLVSKWIKGEES